MHVVTGILASDVSQNGTFLSHYPTGTVQADFTDSEGHVLVVDSAEFTEDAAQISLSFGASSITVTNLTARVFPAGTRIYLQLEPIEQASGVLGKSANEPTGVPIEISVGSGLLLEGRTLSAAGGAGLGDALTTDTLDQFADVTQTAGKTLAITENTTLAGGTHSGTNTGDQATFAIDNVTGLGTGVATVLGINLDAAGAMLYDGGGLGTPASGDLSNCTGLPGGGDVATDVIWSAKGDLAVGTGADTAAVLTVGVNDTIAMAASGQATGIKWATPTEVRTALALVIGTNAQAWDADLDSLASAAGTNTLYYRSGAGTWSSLGMGTGISIAGGSLTLDADLQTWAGITPGANVGTFLATPSSANLRTALTDENGTGAALFDGATSPNFLTSATIGSVAIPTISSTSTLTNKRITKRVVTTTDDATAVIDSDITDVYELSAVANATTFSITGTPTDGQSMVIRYKDAGVSKGLTWTGFTAIGVTLPTATTASKWGYVGVMYNSAATAWHATGVTTEA